MPCYLLLLHWVSPKEGNNPNRHEAVLKLPRHVQSDDDDEGTERGVGSEAEHSKSGDSFAEAGDTESDGDSEATVDETRGGEGPVEETEVAGASIVADNCRQEAHHSAASAAAVEAGVEIFPILQMPSKVAKQPVLLRSVHLKVSAKSAPHACSWLHAYAQRK